MAEVLIRLAIVLVVVAAAVGCATSPVDYFAYSYYLDGPEAALELLDGNEIPVEDRALAEVERAISLLELGRYEESTTALERAEGMLGGVGSGSPVGQGSAEIEPWRPEYHEVVMISMMRIANALALQDPSRAARAADDALARMAEVDCESCGFAFTSVLAALAYERAGRYDDGVTALPRVDALGRGGDLVEALRLRFEKGAAGEQPAGWAPPPVDGDRTLVVVLLLGRGPYKEIDRLAVSETESIRWCRYLPRDPQAVTWAAMDTEEPEISVDLTDMETVAVSGLRLRGERLAVARGEGVGSNPGDLRHWSSLPASLQLIHARLPWALDYIDLVYYSPDGFEVDRETIELPPGWWEGPIFVTRRMP